MASQWPQPSTLPTVLAARARDERRERLRRMSAWVIVLVLVALPPVGWTWFARGGPVPSDGTLLSYPTATPVWGTNDAIKLDEVRGATVEGATSCDFSDKALDETVVKAVGRYDVSDLATGAAGPPHPPSVGDKLTYSLSQDGAPCAVTVELTSYPWLEVAREHIWVLPLVIAMWMIGSFVFIRRPRDPAARALFAMAVFLPYGATAWPFGTQVVDLVNGPRLWPFVIGEAANAMLWAAVLYFTLVFPRPVPWLRRRPAATALVFATPLIVHFVNVAVHGLVRSQDDLEELGSLISLSIEAALIVPVLIPLIVIWQYRRAEDIAERQQVRWVVYTLLVCAAVYLGLGRVPEIVIGDPLVPYDVQPLVFLIVPAALGAAVLRYNLFDVQLVLRRSLVYGALTALLIVIPGTLVLAVEGIWLPRLSNLERWLGAALVVVLVFQTLRARIKQRLSRAIFGDRDDPYEIVTRLGSQLQSSVPAESLLTAIAETVAQTLHLPHVALTLVSPDGVVDSASYGEAQGQLLEIPLMHQGEVVGHLSLDTGSRIEPFGPGDRRLLELLSQQVGVAAHSVLLSSRLQRSLERAVSAREEERRRIRRDIHDGLGPLLAANRMRIELANRLVQRDPDAAAEMLESLVDSQQAAIDDLRRLVEGLRPPVLDQLGLVGAIRERADSFSAPGDETGLVLSVDASEHVEPLPAAVEVAAYRIVLEAITNVVRHAGATDCSVRLSRDKALVVEIVDNGHGLPAVYQAGVGLNSMRERAGEVGGNCSITPGAVGGTVVRAELPVQSPHPGPAAARPHAGPVESPASEGNAPTDGT